MAGSHQILSSMTNPADLPTYLEATQICSPSDRNHTPHTRIPPLLLTDRKSSGTQNTPSGGSLTSGSTWATPKTRPTFIGNKRIRILVRSSPRAKTLSIDAPQGFDDLVQIYRQYSTVPQWYQVPWVIGCPELSGYRWEHQALRWDEDDESLVDGLWEDQHLFETIIKASARTGRRPLCAPDHFFHGSRSAAAILKSLFADRCHIPGARWQFGQIEDDHYKHPDWRPFCAYVTENIPTGEFLIAPDTWTEVLLARTVVELDYFPVHKGISGIVKRMGYEISMPNRYSLKKKWSEADVQIIKSVALKIWTQWRNKAEADLSGMS